MELTVLDRVAAAIARIDLGLSKAEAAYYPEWRHMISDKHMRMARDAVTAMLEPTGEMCGDVHDTLLYAVKGEELDTAALVWERMVGVVLGA